MFEMIYRNCIIGKTYNVPIIGDMFEGLIVWEVDYHHRYAYLTEA